METDRQTQAAIKIQRLWRTHRTKPLDIEARWQDAMDRIQLEVGTESANKGNNSPRSRWRRATMVATRIQNPHGVPVKTTGRKPVSAKPSQYKVLETQHWLELIDGKHRYGSNLKRYHRKWLSENTTDNFFHWLDYGAGKQLSLSECPRDRLESERILYLSAEQQLNYLVKIDQEGKLRWSRNGQLVDTTAGKWKDLGNGMGIGPDESADDSTSSWEQSTKHSSKALAQHYVSHKKRSKIGRVIRNHFTATGVMNKLLRKTVRRNTWIYVTDKDYNLFIGIKATGQFQHSSFLSGGLVTSAGLIGVESGIITKLSPLSGHYRTSIEHFKGMVKVLDSQGAHLGKLDVNKAEVVLWGVSRYAKVKKFSKSVSFSKFRHWHSGRKSSNRKRRKRWSDLDVTEKRRYILYGQK